MSKIIAAINMTLDGVCDHTVLMADEEIHDHYTQLLDSADIILYGRVTYQLMQFWQPLITNPSGEKSMDEFARAIDKIPKVVFSQNLTTTDWNSAIIATQSPEQVALELKQQAGKNILVGSRSLIIELTKFNLIDEYQICVHPVIAGKGLPLFENITERTVLKFIKTKPFSGGAVILYYEPLKR